MNTLDLSLSLGDPKDILNTYPKCAEKLIHWAKEIFPEDVRETIGKEMVDTLIQGILGANPRFLYEFFDSQGVIITVQYMQNESIWLYYNNRETYSESEGGRIEAEKKAFLKAFKTLEGLL